MSKYPVWWDRDVTVYNKHTDSITKVVEWTRHTLSNCFWKDTGDKVQIGNTIMETNNIICRIQENEAYKEPYEWQALPADQKPNFFTLQPGDILVDGIVDDVIDEYQSGHRSTDFLKKYKSLQGCMQVERAANNTGPGRGLPHYYAKGV